MKLIRRLLGIFTFVGGAVFGLSFAQKKGEEFRSSVYKGIKKGKAYDVLSKEFGDVGKDVWKSSLGVKDSEEVRKMIAEAQMKLEKMGEGAKKYGGEVAAVMGKRYEKLAKDISKQATELKKKAEKEIGKVVKRGKKVVSRKKKS